MDIIIIPVDTLPDNGQSGVWYYYNYNYYYWDSVDEQYNPDTTDGKPAGGGTPVIHHQYLHNTHQDNDR